MCQAEPGPRNTGRTSGKPTHGEAVNRTEKSGGPQVAACLWRVKDVATRRASLVASQEKPKAMRNGGMSMSEQYQKFATVFQ